jgi:hypothetical protein
MGTSLKTVCFPFSPLASITNNTLTNFTQMTVDLPEGSKVFKKVWIEFMCDDIITVTGGTITTKTMGFRLGSAGYTTITNSNTLTNSGENLALHIAQDYTSHFTTNWSGTSMTCDLQVQINQSTGTTQGMNNATALLWITYEYDDTSSTMVLNAWIPFNAQLAGLPTSKGSAYDTIPNLDTFLGYGTLSYKRCVVIAEGNEEMAGTATDFTLTCQIDTYTAQVGQNHESALASDRYVREFYDMMSGGSLLFTSNATHSIYWWVSTGAVARMNHASLTMLVVFTFDSTSSNDGNISLLISHDLESGVMGGATSADGQRDSIDLWIEEPATIAIQKSAIRVFWTAISTVGGLAFRAGSQSFNSYTVSAAALCGCNCLQRTIDDNISLARGKNTITCDIYRTDTTDLGWGVTSLFIINYKCGKPSGGWGRANHSVKWNLVTNGTGAAVAIQDISSVALTIPETDYWINSIGAELSVMMHGTSGQVGGFLQMVERLSGEGGVKWEIMGDDIAHDDYEAGIRFDYCDDPDTFLRFPNDISLNNGSSRIDVETSRRYRALIGLQYPCWWMWNLMITYHSIIFTVGDSVSNSNGGTVTIYLMDSNNMPVKSTTRVGNGAFSFSWYDNTANVYCVAREDSTHLGRSDSGVAT